MRLKSHNLAINVPVDLVCSAACLEDCRLQIGRMPDFKPFGLLISHHLSAAAMLAGNRKPASVTGQRKSLTVDYQRLVGWMNEPRCCRQPPQHTEREERGKCGRRHEFAPMPLAGLGNMRRSRSRPNTVRSCRRPSPRWFR